MAKKQPPEKPTAADVKRFKELGFNIKTIKDIEQLRDGIVIQVPEVEPVHLPELESVHLPELPDLEVPELPDYLDLSEAFSEENFSIDASGIAALTISAINSETRNDRADALFWLTGKLANKKTEERVLALFVVKSQSLFLTDLGNDAVFPILQAVEKMSGRRFH